MTLVGEKPRGGTLAWRQAVQTRIATVGDQVLVSATNFGLTLMIGRAFSAEEFASYGIGLSIGLIVQGLQRHAVTIPLMLESRQRAGRSMRAIMSEQLLVLALAIVGGAICCAAAVLLNVDRYGMLVVASSAVILFIYLQLEFSRAFLVKIGRPWLLLASAGWYAAVSAALSLAAIRGHASYELFLAVMASAMLVPVAAMTVITGLPTLRRGGLRFVRDMRRYGGWAAAATLTYTGYNHVPLLILGAMAAPAHAAAFVAARSLLQPLQILLRGFDIADKSRFSEITGPSHRQAALAVTLRLAAFYAGIGVLFGATIALFADPIMTLAYGHKFVDSSAALVAWVPVYVLLSVTMPLESLVYARNDFFRYFAVRGAASLVAIAAAFPLIAAFAEVGAIAACGIGWFLAVAGTVAVLIRRADR